MSTDIVHFPDANAGPFESLFSLGALQLYLLISLPLVVVTLVGWYVFYLWEIRQKDRTAKPEEPNRVYTVLGSFRNSLCGSCRSVLPT